MTVKPRRIKTVYIGPIAGDTLGYQHVVKVTLERSPHDTEVLFAFFPDEISFTREEVVGKTVDEVRALRHAKDVAYLRS